jgi:hypothetical protein
VEELYYDDDDNATETGTTDEKIRQIVTIALSIISRFWLRFG